MNPKTLEALKASIEHWKRNASGNYDGIGVKSCALCQRFRECDTVYNEETDKHEYEKCPVYAKTDLIGCHGSPYEEVYEIICDGRTSTTSPEFLAAAKKELEFLESLLPKDQV